MTTTRARLERISHRELRNNSAEILRRVAAGESFEVTNHGQVVAELSPPRQTSELERLRAAGRTRPATTPRDAVWEIEPVTSPVTTQEMIDDLRGPRL